MKQSKSEKKNDFKLRKTAFAGAIIFLLLFSVTCFAEEGITLINENFEYGYTDRSNVKSDIALSESYDVFADRKKCGYMVYKQVTSSAYSSEKSDRAGYDVQDRIYSGGESAAYGKLGGALYLYPDANSFEKDWWFSVGLGYNEITPGELTDKALDINFALSDSANGARGAKIYICAEVGGREKEYLIGIKSIKGGGQFLNSYHKRVKFKDVFSSVSSEMPLSNLRVKVSAPKDKSSVVKIDDIHIREVDAAEFMSFDFEGEDLFTDCFDKSSVKLSCADLGSSCALKIRASQAANESAVSFKIPNLDKNSSFKVSFKALAPLSNLKQSGIKVKLTGVLAAGEWEIGEIANSDEFSEFSREFSLSDFYGVCENLENAKIEFSFQADENDVFYIDDLSVSILSDLGFLILHLKYMMLR